MFVDLGQCRQSCERAVGLADCDGVVEPDDLSVGEPEELVVPLHNLDPVGLLDTRRVGMERGDRRLRLVFAELIARERSLCDGDPLGDEPGVPLAAVLIGEARCFRRAECGCGGGLGAGASGRATVDLGVVHQGGQLTGQPDRLRREIDVAGMALVEDEVRTRITVRTSPGRSTPARLTMRLARLMLRHGCLGHEVCLAIWRVVRPPTARRVNATADDDVRSGCAHRK